MAAGDVKRELARRGWTITRMAERIGVGVPQVSKVVSGRKVSPFLQEAISDVVGVRAEELFGDLWWRRFVVRRYSGLRAMPPRRREEVST